MNIVSGRTPKSFRIGTAAFASFLFVAAAWIVAAELARASVPFFLTASDVQDASTKSSAAATAAQIGWLRGDLWADYALLSDNSALGNNTPLSAGNKVESKSAVALTAAPYDARLWLVLSALNAKLGWKDTKTLSQLKMSYYTAPNDIRLFPLRLAVSMRPQAIDDEELRTLLGHEIRTIVARKRELKPLLASAYRDTSPSGRQFVEDQLAGLDEAFLKELRAIKR
jgi:hypothetical protein